MNTSADSAAHSGPSDAGRAPKTWGFWLTLAWALGAAAVLFVSQGIVAVILVIATRRAHPEQPFGIEQIVANGPLIAWTIIVSTPFLVAFLALATRRAHRSLIDYLGLKWPGWPQTLLGFVALAGVLALVALAETFAKVDTPAFMTDTFKSAKDMGELPLVAFAFVFAAPFSEEILFRGFLFRGFAKSLGPLAAIVITAVLWASLHVQYQWFFIGEIVALGLLLGTVRWLTGSTLLTFLLHAAVNGTALIMLALDGT
jgi:membrane protease YdiL (CAAX protease family)